MCVEVQRCFAAESNDDDDDDAVIRTWRPTVQ